MPKLQSTDHVSISDLCDWNYETLLCSSSSTKTHISKSLVINSYITEAGTLQSSFMVKVRDTSMNKDAEFETKLDTSQLELAIAKYNEY